MTEAEWVAGLNPKEMLNHLGPRANRRRCLLFACACGRRFWPHQADADKAKVQEWERYAEGEPLAAELLAIYRAVLGVDPDNINFVAWAIGAVESSAVYAARVAEDGRKYSNPLARQTAWDAARDAERAASTVFLRDIFGNPFRPSAFDQVWQTTAAVALARSMYEARDFADTPILADALEEAGCADGAILDHCRDPKQVHVRGCWVVDLVLGKS